MKINLNHYLLSQLKRRMPIGKRNVSDIFFLAFTLSAILFLFPIAIALHWANLDISAYTAYAGLIIISISILIWKNTKRINIALLVYEFTLFGLVLINAYLNGGVNSPVMVWLGVVPLLPLFIKSIQWAYVFLSLAFAVVLIFYGFTFHLNVSESEKSQHFFSAIMFGTFILTQTVLISTVHGIASNRLKKIARNNKRLLLLTEQLSLANEHKEKFLSNVSHEMRTPLNVIHGYLDLLRTRTDLPSEAREHISHVHGASTHMLCLINDLLDYSQIRQGQFTMAIQPVELPTLIQQIFMALNHQAQKKQLSYIYEASATLPKWVKTDPTRLTQILINLLGNAIKFTARGQIQLTVTYRHTHGSADGALHIEVRDTGPGIPLNELDKIYAPFYQIQNVQNMSHGHALQGNGLGLAITKTLIHNWRGKIKVSSTVGAGSIFHVEIPMVEYSDLMITQTAEPPSHFESPRTPQSILVVDDHALNRMVACATIRNHFPNCQIDQAGNGQEALQKMAVQIYDVVLLDIVMPDFSGIEVLRTVRTTYPAPYCAVKTIAFTANVEADIKDQCERTGFDGFLSKPFNAQTLIQMLNYS